MFPIEPSTEGRTRAGQVSVADQARVASPRRTHTRRIDCTPSTITSGVLPLAAAPAPDDESAHRIRVRRDD